MAGDKTLKFFKEEIGVPIFGLLIFVLVIILYVILRMAPGLFNDIFAMVWTLYPVWLPLFLLYIFLKLWKIYIRIDFFHKQEYILLEIKLPREILKSPLAMESVFSGLHQSGGETTWFDRNIIGKARTSFSMEIVSIEGEVKFFIRTRTFWREVVEAQIYAQYPEVEVVEADDYTKMIRFDLNEKAIWGSDFKLKKEDAYPIKTYVDYGLDKDPKEEFKVDPMAPMIEFLGGLGKGEQLWFQIMIRVNKDEKKKRGTLFGTTGWKDEAEALVDKLIIRDSKTKVTTAISPAGFPVDPRISKGEQEIIAAIERSLTKLGFDVGIRGIYIADKDKFRPVNIVGLIGFTKQFSSNTLNQFIPTRYMARFDYPWQDYKGKLQNNAKRRVFDAYRRRSYFFHPYKTQPFVMNTEELATMYHFPGSSVKTPTISRVPSKKSEAPSDLPI